MSTINKAFKNGSPLTAEDMNLIGDSINELNDDFSTLKDEVIDIAQHAGKSTPSFDIDYTDLYKFEYYGGSSGQIPLVQKTWKDLDMTQEEFISNPSLVLKFTFDKLLNYLLERDTWFIEAYGTLTSEQKKICDDLFNKTKSVTKVDLMVEQTIYGNYGYIYDTDLIISNNGFFMTGNTFYEANSFAMDNALYNAFYGSYLLYYVRLFTGVTSSYGYFPSSTQFEITDDGITLWYGQPSSYVVEFDASGYKFIKGSLSSENIESNNGGGIEDHMIYAAPDLKEQMSTTSTTVCFTDAALSLIQSKGEPYSYILDNYYGAVFANYHLLDGGDNVAMVVISCGYYDLNDSWISVYFDLLIKSDGSWDIQVEGDDPVAEPLP